MGENCRVLSRLCSVPSAKQLQTTKERRVDIKMLGIERRNFGSNGVNDLRVISLTRDGV